MNSEYKQTHYKELQEERGKEPCYVKSKQEQFFCGDNSVKKDQKFKTVNVHYHQSK